MVAEVLMRRKIQIMECEREIEIFEYATRD